MLRGADRFCLQGYMLITKSQIADCQQRMVVVGTDFLSVD